MRARRLGIDLGGTKIEGAVLDGDGTIFERKRVPTPRDDYDGTLAAIARLVEELDPSRSCTVGMGIPGTISPAAGVVKNANSTWLNGRALQADVERTLRRPVRLANDANCFALSEAKGGAAAGAQVVFGVILGTGVGGGVVIDGKAIAGANAIAGEWGHNPLPWMRDDERPGPACWCGKNGCVETFLSGPARARDGGAQYDDRLARGLASVINLLDPDVIVLGGGVSNVTELYDNVPRLWSRWIFSDRVDTKLVPPRHGDSSGVRGAAWLW
ncbi:MAG TPA: ROK family protein [Candidatus Polarisedimenticolaceae bacterium]|nr:ROK family protein [Candidatus Polarisedimenticolaceae bacterium]